MAPFGRRRLLPESDEIDAIIEEIQALMTEKVFIFRESHELQAALAELRGLSDRLAERRVTSFRSVQVRNMLTVAQLIVEAALARHDSLGSHVIKASQEVEHAGLES